ncbi:MAG TPA: class I SAM-dependent methyltransferase [Candidatus Acidoferrales bacterium]|jgi:SAM-dependent methyltransferase|nr:class I SAM-dependent methyltransferase [Candidatus Acidoferrales bacterium]
MTASPEVNLWSSAEHALDYLRRADAVPHRVEGEATLLEFIPADPRRVLDLGSGAGRLLALVKAARPRAEFVALDFSPTMLAELERVFGKDRAVTIVAHDLDRPLPALGRFDAVISSFAIHHVRDERKRSIYAEVFAMLEPGGVFCNLEHVASPTPQLHRTFLKALGWEDEDPSNKLLDLETQLRWLREIGFQEVDCHWKWRELAFFAGVKPLR